MSTVGLKPNKYMLALFNVSLYIVPLLLYISYAVNEAWPYSIPIFKFGQGVSGLAAILACILLAKMIFEVRKFCFSLTEDRRILF